MTVGELKNRLKDLSDDIKLEVEINKEKHSTYIKANDKLLLDIHDPRYDFFGLE